MAQKLVWLFSDTHIDLHNSKDNTVLWENAITDVEDNISPDYAIGVGDLTQDGTDAQFNLYKTKKSASSIPSANWRDLAGNHDVEYVGDLQDFIGHFGGYRHELVVGNVVFICMSDENNQNILGNIGTATRTWAENIINSHPTKSIVVVMHHPVIDTTQGTEQGGIFHLDHTDGTNAWAQGLCTDGKIDAWFHGHRHMDTAFGSSCGIPWHINLLGVEHVDVGQTCYHACSGVKPSCSRVLILTEGTKAVTVKVRNHETQAWIDGEEYSFDLPYQFTLGAPPEIRVDSIVPSWTWLGSAKGVTIYGEAFEATPNVKLNGIDALNITFVNATRLTCTVPDSLSVGYYDVKVTNPDTEFSILTNGFEVKVPPLPPEYPYQCMTVGKAMGFKRWSIPDSVWL